MEETKHTPKEISLKEHGSVLITTSTGESIRVIEQDDVIEILGVERKCFVLDKFYSNFLALKLK